MLGEAPPAFDLLYWNGDGTNLPAKMAVEYLRGLCQRDDFAQGQVSGLRRAGPPGRHHAAGLCRCLRDRPHRRLEGQLATGSGSSGRRTRPSSCRSPAISPGSSTRRPRASTATTRTTRPSQATPEAWQGGRHLPRRVVVAALGRVAGGPVRRAWSRRARQVIRNIRRLPRHPAPMSSAVPAA